MSARRSPSSMPATAPSPSASCSRKMRAPTGKFSSRSAFRRNAAAACRLSALADISFGEGATSIVRYDRQRQASVEADLVGGAALSDARRSRQGAAGDEEPAAGITVSEGGDAELQAELFEGFGEAMRNGLMMVYVVLALLFASLLQPLTILFSLPLSIAGAIIALLITNLPITTPGGHRHPDADGHRDQERDHAGRLRGRGDARRR